MKNTYVSRGGALFSKKVHSNGALCQGVCPKPTKAELEILEMFCHQFMTPHQIAKYRGTKKRVVYKILRNCRMKGFLSPNNDCEIMEHKSPKNGSALPQEIKGGGSHPKKCTSTGKNHLKQYRLHSQQFRIELLNKSDRYEALRKQGDTITREDNTIRLHKDAIEIYANVSFIGPDCQSITNDSLKYWRLFFRRLEKELGIVILKDRSQNIRMVKAGHYSELKNELAQECLKTGQKVRIRGHDGKTWFVIDNSFNLEEAETVHPERSKADMEDVIKPFFDDLRSGQCMKMSEISYTLKEVLEYMKASAHIQKETAEGLNIVVKLLTNSMQPQQGDAPKSRPEYAL